MHHAVHYLVCTGYVYVRDAGLSSSALCPVLGTGSTDLVHYFLPIFPI